MRNHILVNFMVRRCRFEPPTRGFSVHCSTPELANDFNNLLTQINPLSQYSNKWNENGSIRKRNRKFQAQIRRDCVTAESKTSTNKKKCHCLSDRHWGENRRRWNKCICPKATSLADLITLYSQEITPLKKWCDVEQRRLSRLLIDPIAGTSLIKRTSAQLAELRDRRMNDVVRAAHYDMILFNCCIKTAQLEWGVPRCSNPAYNLRILNGIKRPCLQTK